VFLLGILANRAKLTEHKNIAGQISNGCDCKLTQPIVDVRMYPTSTLKLLGHLEIDFSCSSVQLIHFSALSGLLLSCWHNAVG